MRNSGGERELFEVAHAYRAVYALRTAYDRKSFLTVSAAIAYGERIPADGPPPHAGRPSGIGEVRPLLPG